MLIENEKIKEVKEIFKSEFERLNYSIEQQNEFIEKYLKKVEDVKLKEIKYNENTNFVMTKYNKIIFITTNELINKNVSINQLSISKFENDVLDENYTNYKFIDRFYYSSNSNHTKENKKIMKLRKKEKANYKRTFDLDKKNVMNFIGEINEKTLVVCFNFNNAYVHFGELLESNCDIFDLFNNLTYVFDAEKTGFIPALNYFSVRFDYDLLLNSSVHFNSCLMNVFYKISRFFGIENYKERNDEALKLYLEKHKNI